MKEYRDALGQLLVVGDKVILPNEYCTVNCLDREDGLIRIVDIFNCDAVVLDSTNVVKKDSFLSKIEVSNLLKYALIAYKNYPIPTEELESWIAELMSVY